MMIVLYKGDSIVKSFEDCSDPFEDILSFNFDGESQFLTVRFAGETRNGEPQTFTAQFGSSFDRCYIGERGK